MKKELLCMMLGCALIFSGCSNVDLGENFDSGINTTQQMTVNFVPMVLGEGTGNSRVAASSYNDPTKVTILAYKKSITKRINWRKCFRKEMLPLL